MSKGVLLPLGFATSGNLAPKWSHGQSEEANARRRQEARLLCRRAYVLGLTLTGQVGREMVAEATMMARKMGLSIEGLLHVKYPKNHS